MTAWLRRNRWYLLALVVLVPASIAVAFVPRWLPYQAGLPQFVDVPRGETAAYSGAEVALTALELLDGEEWGARVGADIVVATLSIDVTEPVEGAYCDIDLVSLDGGLERTWRTEIGGVGDYDIPDDLSESCTFTEEGAHEFQVTFLVPAGQVETASVRITSSTALPQALQLN